MTRKDFIFIANTIAESHMPAIAKLEMIKQFANELDSKYSKFNKQRFISYTNNQIREYELKSEENLI